MIHETTIINAQVRGDISRAIQAERERARTEGISRETLPTAREGQLDGYLAGLRKAQEIAEAL